VRDVKMILDFVPCMSDDFLCLYMLNILMVFFIQPCLFYLNLGLVHHVAPVFCILLHMCLTKITIQVVLFIEYICFA
jgi:hypothetical protein